MEQKKIETLALMAFIAFVILSLPCVFLGSLLGGCMRSSESTGPIEVQNATQTIDEAR